MCYHHPRRKEKHSFSLFSKNWAEHLLLFCNNIKYSIVSIFRSQLNNWIISLCYTTDPLSDNQCYSTLPVPVLVTETGNQVPRCHLLSSPDCCCLQFVYSDPASHRDLDNGEKSVYSILHIFNTYRTCRIEECSYAEWKDNQISVWSLLLI